MSHKIDRCDSKAKLGLKNSVKNYMSLRIG